MTKMSNIIRDFTLIHFHESRPNLIHLGIWIENSDFPVSRFVWKTSFTGLQFLCESKWWLAIVPLIKNLFKFRSSVWIKVNYLQFNYLYSIVIAITVSKIGCTTTLKHASRLVQKIGHVLRGATDTEVKLWASGSKYWSICMKCDWWKISLGIKLY